MHTQLWQMRLVVSLLVVLSGILGLPRRGPAHVGEFTCAAGDVACLIDAITQANSTGVANTITLEAGTYTLTEVNNPTEGRNGLPLVTGIMTIQGAGADTTIIERDASASGFGLVRVAATGALTLEGLTLRGGTGISGGGITNNGGRLTLVRVALEENGGGGDAGGLANVGGTVVIAETIFRHNLVPFGGGGLANLSFSEGLPADQAGQVLITTTTFDDNHAPGGGGLRNETGGTVTITQTTFVRNGSGFGGGLANFGTAFLQNTTFAANRATDDGAGLINFSGTAILTNSTIAANSADGRGGGLSNAGGQLAVLNTILAGNTASRNAPDCNGSVTSLGTNLIGDPTGCTITLLPTDLTGDPGLGDFTDDGTPGNGHVPLLPGSPAIDAGNDAFCPPTDQLEQPRVGPCDIGAIEFQGKGHHHQKDNPATAAQGPQ
jgi:hypothetical protein